MTCERVTQEAVRAQMSSYGLEFGLELERGAPPPVSPGLWVTAASAGPA